MAVKASFPHDTLPNAPIASFWWGLYPFAASGPATSAQGLAQYGARGQAYSANISPGLAESRGDMQRIPGDMLASAQLKLKMMAARAEQEEEQEDAVSAQQQQQPATVQLAAKDREIAQLEMQLQQQQQVSLKRTVLASLPGASQAVSQPSATKAASQQRLAAKAHDAISNTASALRLRDSEGSRKLVKMAVSLLTRVAEHWLHARPSSSSSSSSSSGG